MGIIKESLTEKRWSVVQATAGAPNKKTGRWPYLYGQWGDKPLYWTGATPTTEAKPWLVESAAGFFSEEMGGEKVAPNGKYMVYLGNRIWMAGMANDKSCGPVHGVCFQTGRRRPV